jgi:hypothetical protein
VARRSCLGCLLLTLALGGCQQTVSLDDSTMDGGFRGTGGGSGPTDAASSGGADGGHCFGSPQSIAFTPDEPQVLIVLDRSTGMSGTSFGPQDTELSAALTTLSAEVSYYAPGTSQQGHNKPTIGFSYLDFPDSGSDCNGAASCCASNVTPTNDNDDFLKVTGACSGSGMSCVQSSSRPIATAISAAPKAFSQSSNMQNGERFVLLVTGGPPSGNCPLAGSSPGSNDCLDAINAVGDLANAGIDTYIVGLGDQSNLFCLMEMADSTSSSFYSPATSESDLMTALGSILATIAQNGCRLTLSPAVTSPGQLAVTYDGMTVNQDRTNGWSLDSTGTRLRLNGNACQSFVLNESGPFGLQISQPSCNQRYP